MNTHETCSRTHGLTVCLTEKERSNVAAQVINFNVSNGHDSSQLLKHCEACAKKHKLPVTVYVCVFLFPTATAGLTIAVACRIYMIYLSTLDWFW